MQALRRVIPEELTARPPDLVLYGELGNGDRPGVLGSNWRFFVVLGGEKRKSCHGDAITLKLVM